MSFLCEPTGELEAKLLGTVSDRCTDNNTHLAAEIPTMVEMVDGCRTARAG